MAAFTKLIFQKLILNIKNIMFVIYCTYSIKADITFDAVRPLSNIIHAEGNVAG